MTSESRQKLMQECFQLLEKIESFDEIKMLKAGTKKYIQACEQHSANIDSLKVLYNEYKESVPIIPLSRCPFCQQVIHHSLDTYDLDGLWWNYRGSVRPDYYQNTVCPHYLQISGAVHLSRPIKSIPMLVSPGPEVPFVLPRLLEKGSVRAVIYSIEVGKHQAYPIFYFTESKKHKFELFNSWGDNYYEWENEEGKLIFDLTPETERHYDFKLESWIKNGKLFWINPGDIELKLRNDVEDCPYLNLPGCRERLYIEEGKIRSSKTI
jgi:hypothetical protein